MRKAFVFLLTLIALVSCSKEENVVEVVLDESIIPEDAENVSLRPTFGFGSVYGGLRTTYTIYCDTLSTPEQQVASSSEIFNIMSDESVLLKPSTKYYWYCKAEKDGKVFPTGVYSFTTIDTATIRNNSWNSRYVLTLPDYEEQRAQDYYSYDLPADSCYIYSEPVSFTVSDNAVTDAYRYGDYNRELSTEGTFDFNLDEVTILEWKYEFINFGVEYFAANNNNANKIVLVLKQPHSGDVVVFEKNE